MNEYNSTINRYVYNRLRKEYVANKNGLCSFCKYHKNENQTGKWYGGFTDYSKPESEFTCVQPDKITYPNWKLVSKNKKQWMNKKLKTKLGKTRGYWMKGYFTFEF
jgi:hypothetical protein